MARIDRPMPRISTRLLEATLGLGLSSPSSPKRPLRLDFLGSAGSAAGASLPLGGSTTKRYLQRGHSIFLLTCEGSLMVMGASQLGQVSLKLEKPRSAGAGSSISASMGSSAGGGGAAAGFGAGAGLAAAAGLGVAAAAGAAGLGAA